MREKRLVNTHIHFAVFLIFNLYVTFATSTFVSLVTSLEWELRMALATPEFGDLGEGTEGKIENILLLVPCP